jgi:hypothetical protein
MGSCINQWRGLLITVSGAKNSARTHEGQPSCKDFFNAGSWPAMAFTHTSTPSV